MRRRRCSSGRRPSDSLKHSHVTTERDAIPVPEMTLSLDALPVELDPVLRAAVHDEEPFTAPLHPRVEARERGVIEHDAILGMPPKPHHRAAQDDLLEEVVTSEDLEDGHAVRSRLADSAFERCMPFPGVGNGVFGG